MIRGQRSVDQKSRRRASVSFQWRRVASHPRFWKPWDVMIWEQVTFGILGATSTSMFLVLFFGFWFIWTDPHWLSPEVSGHRIRYLCPHQQLRGRETQRLPWTAGLVRRPVVWRGVVVSFAKHPNEQNFVATWKRWCHRFCLMSWTRFLLQVFFV